MCRPAGPLLTRILEQTRQVAAWPVQVFLSLFHASLVQKVRGPSPEQAPALLTPAPSSPLQLCSMFTWNCHGLCCCPPRPLSLSPHNPLESSLKAGSVGLTGSCAHGQRRGGEPV